LRLEQGLPPLLVPTKEEQEAERKAREEAIQQAIKEKEAMEIQARIEKSKKKRKLNKVMKGKSLAEVRWGKIRWVSFLFLPLI